MPFAVILAIMNTTNVVFLTVFLLLFACVHSNPVALGLTYPVNGNTERALKDETGKTWHDVEVWTLSLRTTDNPSRADQREHLVEPQQDDKDENSRLATGDRKTRKRKKMTQRLKKLLLLIFISGLWSSLILLPKCILNILASSV